MNDVQINSCFRLLYDGEPEIRVDTINQLGKIGDEVY